MFTGAWLCWKIKRCYEQWKRLPTTKTCLEKTICTRVDGIITEQCLRHPLIFHFEIPGGRRNGGFRKVKPLPKSSTIWQCYHLPIYTDVVASTLQWRNRISVFLQQGRDYRLQTKHMKGIFNDIRTWVWKFEISIVRSKQDGVDSNDDAFLCSFWCGIYSMIFPT